MVSVVTCQPRTKWNWLKSYVGSQGPLAIKLTEESNSEFRLWELLIRQTGMWKHKTQMYSHFLFNNYWVSTREKKMKVGSVFSRKCNLVSREHINTVIIIIITCNTSLTGWRQCCGQFVWSLLLDHYDLQLIKARHLHHHLRCGLAHRGFTG